MGTKLQGVGGGGTGEPIKLQGFAGSHTRPARPPEAKLRRTAGGSRLCRTGDHVFPLGGS